MLTTHPGRLRIMHATATCAGVEDNEDDVGQAVLQEGMVRIHVPFASY